MVLGAPTTPRAWKGLVGCMYSHFQNEFGTPLPATTPKPRYHNHKILEHQESLEASTLEHTEIWNKV